MSYLWVDTDGNYCAVVIDKLRKLKGGKRFSCEYHCGTPEELIKKVRRDGYDLGTVPHVKRLCEIAPSSPYRLRRKWFS